MDYPSDLNLNLCPAFSDNLLNVNKEPSQIFDLFGKNDYSFYDKINSDEKFNEDYQKVFNPIDDNKNDSIDEIDDLDDMSDVEKFTNNFLNKLKDYYYKKDFDRIIEKIEKRFNCFFNDKTNGLLYFLQKLKFFELLGQNKIEEAKQFFKEKLLILIKEVKKESWEKKSKFFIKLINNPNLIIKQGDLEKKYFDRFTYEFEKAIRIYFHEVVDENNLDNELIFSKSNIDINHFISSSSIEFIDPLVKKNSFNEINTSSNNTKEISKNEIEIENNKEEDKDKDDLDLENCSTKEEFSDFEDEICQKCVNNQEQKEEKIKNCINIDDMDEINNMENINNFNNKEEILGKFEEYALDPVYDNKPIKSFLSNNYKNIGDVDEPIDNNENINIIDTSSKKINKINNKEKYNKNYDEINTSEKTKKKENKNKNKKNKNNKKEQTIFNQLPLLNSFKPKYIKRETIDKKIIRNFKNYVVKADKEKRLEITEKTMDYNFFINLINGNLLPPLNFYDLNTGEYIKFNSFNCSYLLWFFSKKGVKEVYNQFINEKGKEFINNISEYYEISEEEKNQLNTYIMNFPNIFDISLVNYIAQGTEISHMYRTVEKNKKINERKRKENDLDLKRMKSGENQRERSRSRDFDDDNDMGD